MISLNRAVSVILVIAMVSMGCTKGVEKDSKEITDVVQRYDYALIEVYKKLDPKPLYGIASEKEIGRVRMIVWQFIGEKNFMESELKELKFVKVTRKGPDAAEVETKETWRYRHLKEETKEVVKPWMDADYRLLFQVVKEKDKWIIQSAKFLN